MYKYKHGNNPWRIINGLLFMSFLFIAGFLGNPLTPMSKTIRGGYDKVESDVTSSSVVYTFMQFLIGLPSIVIAKKIGIKWSVKLCMFVMAVGTLVRCLINQWFYSVHIG